MFTTDDLNIYQRDDQMIYDDILIVFVVLEQRGLVTCCVVQQSLCVYFDLYLFM